MADNNWLWQLFLQQHAEELDPSTAMRRLQQQQVEDEAKWNKMMRPQMLKNMGLIEENGTLRPMTEAEKIAGMSEDERSAYETDRLLAERQNLAARGELKTPGYIENELSRQREQQQIALSQRLGARGAKLSTPGIRGTANQIGLEAGVRSNYSYGQEQQGLGLLGQSQNYLGNLAGRNMQVYGGFPTAGAALVPQGQMAMQPYTFGTQLAQSQNRMMEDRSTAEKTAGARAIGTIGGAALSKYYLGTGM